MNYYVKVDNGGEYVMFEFPTEQAAELFRGDLAEQGVESLPVYTENTIVNGVSQGDVYFVLMPSGVMPVAITNTDAMDKLIGLVAITNEHADAIGYEHGQLATLCDVNGVAV